MVPGGLNEIVSYFVGYLHLAVDPTKVHSIYHEGAYLPRSEDYMTPRPEYIFPADLAEMVTKNQHPTGAFQYPYSSDTMIRRFEQHDEPEISGGSTVPNSERDLPKHTSPDVDIHGIRVSAEGPFTVTLNYGTGGDQAIAEIDQLNKNADNDTLLTQPEDAALLPDFGAIYQAIASMVSGTADLVPSEFIAPQSSSDALVDFVTTRDAITVARAAEGGGGEPDDAVSHTVEPGYYLDGVLSDPPPEDEETEEEVEPDYGTAPGQWADTGSNVAMNLAQIGDLAGSARTVVVMGDVYKTNIIVQINAYMDDDQVTVKGGAESSQIDTGGSTAENGAHLEQLDGVYADAPTTIDGRDWNIDIVEGDFYDVHVLRQRNFLSDNDTVVQDSSSIHYELYSGGNYLINLASLGGSGLSSYDVIVVTGNMHSANLIYQQNILYDNDRIISGVTEHSGEDPDGLGGERATTHTTGKNELVNAAEIVSYGDDKVSPVSSTMKSFLEALNDRPSSYEPSIDLMKELNGNGWGTLNVLFIKGNYYDINAVWQTNIVADSDTLVQRGEAGEGAWSNTGENLLLNDATIIDVGATTLFVGGNAYSESILVQAELISPEQDSVVFRDTNTLVPELIAFTEPQDDCGDDDGLTVLPSVIHDDLMSSVLS